MSTAEAPAVPIAVTERSSPPWSRPDVRHRCWAIFLIAPALLIPAWSFLIPNLSSGRFWQLAQAPVLLLTLVVAAVTDFGWRKIPNWLTYPMFGWAIGCGIFSDFAPWSHPDSAVSLSQGWLFPMTAFAIFGAMISGLIMLMIYSLASGGAGDVKLAMVIGACVGAEWSITALVATYITAAVGVGLWLIWTIGPRDVVQAFVKRVGRIVVPLWTPPISEQEKKLMERPVALGPFFALGTILTILAAEGHLPWIDLTTWM